jgi:mono/diheme cytochrome c family protein
MVSPSPVQSCCWSGAPRRRARDPLWLRTRAILARHPTRDPAKDATTILRWRAPKGPTRREQDAYERARPVFERYCASCHTSGAGKRAAPRHFTMDRYPFGGHHAEQVSSTIREVLGASGQSATMPKDRPGAVQGDDLRAILDWADAFDRAHAAANPSDHHHEH